MANLRAQSVSPLLSPKTQNFWGTELICRSKVVSTQASPAQNVSGSRGRNSERNVSGSEASTQAPAVQGLGAAVAPEDLVDPVEYLESVRRCVTTCKRLWRAAKR